MSEERRDRNEGERMGSGDAARRTPYELVFAEGPFEPEVFPRIQREATEQGVDPSQPERFAFLSVVGEALRTVLPPDAPPEALDQYRAILFHAFNFWRFEKRAYVLEKAVCRYLVEAAPRLSGWEMEIPFPAAYLQLPPNLFWGSISPDSVPEPVDGFFVTMSAGDDAAGVPFQRVEVLVVLGVRRDRAGFSVVPISTETGAGIPAVWAETRGREEGADFENVLPGGDVAGLYSILTTTEALKLVARAFWFISENPGSLSETAPLPMDAATGAEEVPKPRLPYFRVSLQGEAEDDSGENPG